MKTLIRGARVIDPAQQIDSKLDILIENGAIHSLVLPGTYSPSGNDQVIDASGLTACPGFIDIHMHEDVLDENGQIIPCIFPAMLRMGVTSVLAGNCGSNRYDPVSYLDLVDRGGCAVNVAVLAGHTYFRKKAGAADKYAPASKKQREAVKAYITDALNAGCIGISFGLRYVPGATTEEFLDAASVAAAEKHLISAHVRDDAAYVFEAVREFALAGEKYQVPLEVSHIGSMGGYGQMRALLAQIDSYRAKGINITADCYPYEAFCTQIGETTYDDGWLARYDCDYSAVEMCEGKYKGQRLTREGFEEMRRDHPEALSVCHVMRSADIDAAFAHPWVMAGSDGTLNSGQGHPRAAGTFPRFISVYVREKKLLTLYAAIEKMTTLPAQRIGIPRKGNLKRGSDADIVIFDPETICDRSTFSDPLLPPAGISHVLIGGRVAAKNGKITDGRLGRALRRRL